MLFVTLIDFNNINFKNEELDLNDVILQIISLDNKNIKPIKIKMLFNFY